MGSEAPSCEACTWVAVILFTGLGQSVLGLIALIYAVAPWFVWALTALSTTVLAEAFVIHYSRIAYERTQAEEVSSREIVPC